MSEHDKAILSFNKQTIELPIYPATLGNNVIDVRHLGQYGVYTYDNGFYATAACESVITYIDGNKGVLLHRGYPIEQLATHSDYLRVCYLLMNGELPTQSEQQTFLTHIQQQNTLPDELITYAQQLPQSADPISMMMSILSVFPTFYPETPRTPAQRHAIAIQLIAQIPIITAMAYRQSQGLGFIPTRNDLSYAGNFLNMLFDSLDIAKHPVLARAIDRVFMLHADHEQNASTSSVRAVGSTGVTPYAAIVAGIAALWGPAHGGANQACLRMLQEIGDEKHIDAYIKRAKDPNDSFRLMGFGHRVYKNYDPRAKIMRDTCHEVLQNTDHSDKKLIKLAMKLEKIALEDEYFVEKKLYPNVDFYSGITLNAFNIPSNLFTPIFVLARTVGWMAHWMEMMNDPQHRLTRPRQYYRGKARRDMPDT